MDKKYREEKEIEQDVETLINGDRVIAFSDAVFAFAATLLVLKIDLPQIPPEALSTQFSAELLKLWPQYTANFISFLIIAYYWRLHHKLFILIKRYDNVLVWINTFILISVAFLPFPIDLFGTYPSIGSVVIFYTLSISLVGFLILVLWLYAAQNHRLIDKGMSKRVIIYHTIDVAIAPCVFLFSVPLAQVHHIIAKISWIFVLIFLCILNTGYKLTKKEKTSYNPPPL